MSTLVFVESAEDELSQQAVVMAASLGPSGSLRTDCRDRGDSNLTS